MDYRLVKKKMIVGMSHDNALLLMGIKNAIKQIKHLLTSSEGKESSLEEKSPEKIIDTLNNAIMALHAQQVLLDREEKKRAWISEGLSEFVEIQQYGNSDIGTYYQHLISKLVKYLNANQGGLFITNQMQDDNTTLELVASYAYNKKKYLDKTILPGQGLLGQCYLEKEYILLSEIPNGYTSITSGLGETTPGCLLIFPLIADEKVVGIVELASFHLFENHHIDFLKKLGESIASTIYNFKSNERTKELLQVSHEHMEELRAQEEELRQNMEEMAAMQEQIQEQLESTRRLKRELEIREEVFGYTTILSESDQYGTITFVNDKLCEVSKYSREELLGKGHNIFRHPDMPSSLFKTMWDTIKSGKIFQGIVKNRAKDGTHYWVDATIVPVKADDGKIIKYIGARYHIKDDTLAETLYHKQLEALVTA